MLDRRTFLRAGVAASAASALGLRPRLARAVEVTPILTAMHVRPGDEGIGSLRRQLAQAAGNGVDVVWWTSHDGRLSALGYVTALDLRSEQMAVPLGTVALVRESGNGGAVTADGLDPGGAVWLLDDRAARKSMRRTLADLTITVTAAPITHVTLEVTGSKHSGRDQDTTTLRISSAGRTSWEPWRGLPGGMNLRRRSRRGTTAPPGRCSARGCGCSPLVQPATVEPCTRSASALTAASTRPSPSVSIRFSRRDFAVPRFGAAHDPHSRPAPDGAAPAARRTAPVFDPKDPDQQHLNPLAGLAKFGPFTTAAWSAAGFESKVAILAPYDAVNPVRDLLNSLWRPAEPQERKDYLPSYSGFT